MNISNAKVASSSLDKITAEYLEEQLSKDLKPATTDVNVEVVVENPPVETAPSGPVLIVATEKEEEAPAEEREVEEEETQTDDEQSKGGPESTEPTQATGPKVGQQVGFIDLGNLPVRREPRRRGEKA